MGLVAKTEMVFENIELRRCNIEIIENIIDILKLCCIILLEIESVISEKETEMYTEILGIADGAAFNHEFYRKCPCSADLSEVLIGSLHLTPAQAWQTQALEVFGDWLINIGIRMKKLAQPRAVLSQEML